VVSGRIGTRTEHHLAKLSNVMDVLGKQYERSFIVQRYAQTGVRQTWNLPGRPGCRESPHAFTSEDDTRKYHTRLTVANSNTTSRILHLQLVIFGWMIGKR
jgi:hypothetical protein